jgi:hypothetical protein
MIAQANDERIRRPTMLIDRLTGKHPLKSDTLRMIAQGTLAALVVSVSVVVVSQLLGPPAHPGVAAALAAVCASSHTASKKRV